jgi:hypothetical protein
MFNVGKFGNFFYGRDFFYLSGAPEITAKSGTFKCPFVCVAAKGNKSGLIVACSKIQQLYAHD